ncbi:Plasmodium exported protein, unknown function [Plasmodium vivax]|uniref:Variable surface protein Vir35 n=1 Tax=Plasmodium vivax TaxID=5855 RepID=A0A565A792_PLAVI|nr:Plasmodium exported protein, unknown function [Plasmodium vivax]
MELLRNYNFRDSIKFVVLLKFFTYIYLTWNPNNDMCPRSNDVEMKFKLGRTLNIRFNRLLAKHELKNDLYKTHVRHNYADYGMNKNMKNEAEKKSTYSQVKGKSLNKLDAYKQGYKRRYSKKKGLAKLECSYEKKIFDMIDRLGEQQVGLSNYNIKLKKNIVRKRGIGIIVICLIPLIGIILSILDVIKGTTKVNGNFESILLESGIPKPVYIIYGIFFIILTYIILFSIIYTMTKVVKYHRLEAGRGKLNFREYCLFCKDIFLPKGHS